MTIRPDDPKWANDPGPMEAEDWKLTDDFFARLQRQNRDPSTLRDPEARRQYEAWLIAHPVPSR